MAMEYFVIASTFSGFHVYRVSWVMIAGEEVMAERELDNPEDLFVVALKKGNLATYHTNC